MLSVEDLQSGGGGRGGPVPHPKVPCQGRGHNPGGVDIRHHYLLQHMIPRSTCDTHVTHLCTQGHMTSGECVCVRA